MSTFKLEPEDIFIVDSRESSVMPPRRGQVAPRAPSLSIRQSTEPTAKHRPRTQDRAVQAEQQLPTPASQTHSDDEDILSSTPTSSTIQGDTIAALGIHSRHLFQTINRLEALGIQSTLPSLPKFVVVGDQSAGKSSIVEALCNVSLPRSAGTCTRCPFLLTTSTSNTPWQCEVSLQEKYIYDAAARHTTFERWVEQPIKTTTFEVIENKALLGDVLQRAQASLLTQAGTQVLFSPNVICLKISGPELPELSFYDLPGSINVVENDDDQHLVDFVERLVKSYLVDDKALIMLACASDQDIENSTTFKFIRQCKAEQRCLGVLTKPDLLQPARLHHASRMLNNEVFKLGKGWFVTKQPSQAELDQGVLQPEAQAREHSFFAQAPWNTSLVYFAARYGVPHLQTAISFELRQHILDNIGEIVSRVQTRHDEIKAALCHFRSKDPHPMATVLTVLANIHNSLSRYAQSGSDKIDFRPRINKLKEQFRNQLRAMAPELDSTTPETTKKSREATVTPRNADVIMLDEDSDDDTAPTPTPARTVAPKRRARDIITPASNKRIKSDPSAPPSTSARTRVTSLSKVIFTIPQLLQIRERYTESSIPEQVDPKVHEVIILQSMAGWGDVLDQALRSVRKLVIDLVDAVTSQELTAYASCELRLKAQHEAHRLADGVLNDQSEEAKDRLACEFYKPGTVIDIAVQKAAAADELYKKRNTKRLNEAIEKQESDTGKTVSAAEKAKRLHDDNITKPSANDPHAGVVKLLVLPLAYYRVAADRFADEFALQLEYKLIRVLKDRMGDALRHNLGTTDPLVCEQLLVEDAERERERKRLVQEMERLERAMQELNDLPNAPM